MTRQPVFLFLFLALLAASCHSASEQFKLTPQTTITLAQVPDIGLNRFGYVQRPGAEPGFYYFADTRTRRKVYFYDEQGKLIDTVALCPLMPNDDHISNVVVKSRDTIVATSGRDGYIYTFGKNKVYSIAATDPLLYQGLKYVILGGPGKADFARDIAYSAIDLDASRLDYPDTVEPKTKYYFNRFYRGPQIARIMGLTSGTPKVELMIEGLPQRFLSDAHEGGFFKVFAVSDEAVFYHFSDADTLYKFNRASGKLEQAVKIEAGHGKVMTDRMAFGGDVQAFTDKNRDESGIIHYMDYDPYRKLLYLRYYHDVPANTPPAQKGEHRAWELLVYDTGLNKIAEVPFAADSYNPKSLIATPKGILLEKTTLNQTDNDNRKDFQLFAVERGGRP